MIANSKPSRTYLVGYELTRGDGSQARLANAIASHGGRWARPLTGLWFVESSEDIATLERLLAPLVSDEDGLIIQEVTGRVGAHNTTVRWTPSYPRDAGFERGRGDPGRPAVNNGLLPFRKPSVVSSPL